MERFFALLRNISYKSGGFALSQKDGSIFLQHCQHLPDTDQPVKGPIEQRGRKWYISPHMTDGEFIQTALMAVLAFEEHEAREGFTYLGDRIFSPHKSVASLRVVAEEKRSVA